MDRIKRNSTNKKRVIIAIIVAVVLVGAYLAFASLRHVFPFATNSPNYEPGDFTVNKDKTNTEKQVIDNLKDNPQDKTKNDQTDTPPAPTVDANSGKQQANVLITNAGVFNGTVSASGFASNIVESEGVCTYTFTNSESTVVKISDVLPNPSSTTCATVSFPVSELSASGTWSVKLSYSSSRSIGASQAKEFQK